MLIGGWKIDQIPSLEKLDEQSVQTAAAEINLNIARIWSSKGIYYTRLHY